MNNSLSYKNHIHNVITRLSEHSGVKFRLRQFLPKHLLPMFAQIVHANIDILFTSEREIIYSANCSKFAAESD